MKLSKFDQVNVSIYYVVALQQLKQKPWTPLFQTATYVAVFMVQLGKDL